MSKQSIKHDLAWPFFSDTWELITWLAPRAQTPSCEFAWASLRSWQSTETFSQLWKLGEEVMKTMAIVVFLPSVEHSLSPPLLQSDIVTPNPQCSFGSGYGPNCQRWKNDWFGAKNLKHKCNDATSAWSQSSSPRLWPLMLLPHRLQVWGGIPISSQTQGVFRSVFTLAARWERPNGNLLLFCKFATLLEHVQCIQRKNFGSLASLLPFGSFAYLFGLHAVEAWTCKTETCETLGRPILLLTDSDLFIPSPGCLQGYERGNLYQHQFNSNCLPLMSIEHLRRLVLQDRLVPCPWPLRTQLIWFTQQLATTTAELKTVLELFSQCPSCTF